MPKQATKTKKSAPAARKSGTNSKTTSTSTASEQNSMLEKFVVDQLKDIYYAEKQLLKALPKMEGLVDFSVSSKLALPFFS